ncbi:LamB/YcsF family protein [Ruegeria atlantica]|uniref:LamB/YcsF family protein n=1 Tax=Ruegeria atlantica TaxID=81569 RepID=UPI002494DBAB|nr:5-oxoprolinase subunit PxpA [Ruegeria atlantica]
MPSVDLNADMGESFGPWNMGDDESLLKIITSANIACGFHAGDPDVMAKTMTLAAKNGVGIGAHPGFPDLQGFGRRNMKVPHASLRNLVRYQLGAAIGMAKAVGTEVRHLKLHGALANMCSVDIDMARACYQGALDVDPDIIIMVLAVTKQEEAVRELECKWVGEIFADRAYNDDGTLVDRSMPGAVIHDPEIAGLRILNMVREGAIITESGQRLETSIDTICLHGDGPTAVQIARSVRTSLIDGGVDVTKFMR